MSKNTVKVLVAVAIWAAAGYFAHSYYKTLFPDLPNRRGARAAGRGFVHPDKDIAAFMKGDPPRKLTMEISRAKASDSETRFSTMGQNRSEIIVAKGQTVAAAVAMLKGVPAWKVTQLPVDRNRWNVFVKTPAMEDNAGRSSGNSYGERRQQMTDRFLGYLNWEIKTGKRPTPLYRFRSRTPEDGAAPQLSEFSAVTDRMRFGNWRPKLSDISGMLSGMGSAPALSEVDADVRANEAALPEGQSFQFPRMDDPAKTARYICALYDVACDISTGEAESFLVYHPKFAKAEDLRAWEEGKPVTPEEKERAAETEPAAADGSTTTSATL